MNSCGRAHASAAQGKTHRSILIFADNVGIRSLTSVTQSVPPESQMVTKVPENRPKTGPE
jgi:hypothetical protein